MTDIAKEKRDEIIIREQAELDKQKEKDSVLTIPDTISIQGESVELQEF